LSSVLCVWFRVSWERVVNQYHQCPLELVRSGRKSFRFSNVVESEMSQRHVGYYEYEFVDAYSKSTMIVQIQYHKPAQDPKLSRPQFKLESRGLTLVVLLQTSSQIPTDSPRTHLPLTSISTTLSSSYVTRYSGAFPFSFASGCVFAFSSPPNITSAGMAMGLTVGKANID